MSNTARKTRKRAHLIALEVDAKLGTQHAPRYAFRHPVKVGTPFADRLANQPRQVFGVASWSSSTRFGITSRVAAGYRARGLALPISTRVR